MAHDARRHGRGLRGMVCGFPVRYLRKLCPCFFFILMIGASFFLPEASGGQPPGRSEPYLEKGKRIRGFPKPIPSGLIDQVDVEKEVSSCPVFTLFPQPF